MLGAIIAAAAITATPSPAPSSTVSYISAKGPEDPCKHRVFCGRIAFVPRDPVERRAFYMKLGTQFLDGVITAVGLRGSRAQYADLWTHAVHPLETGCTTWQGMQECWSAPPTYVPANVVTFSFGAPHSFEIDPLAAVSAHGGLPTLVAGGLAWDAIIASTLHRAPVATRVSYDYLEAGTHLVGAATWFGRLAGQRVVAREYAHCSLLVSQYGMLNASTSSLNNIWFAPDVSASSIKACQDFSSIPLTGGKP